MALDRDEVFSGTSPMISVPREAIRLAPSDSIQGTLIQRAQTNQQQVVRPVITPNVQRIKNLVTGNFDFYVQFMRDPADPAYTGTTVYLQGAAGTQALSGISGNGPIKFNTPATTAASSISTQTNTIDGNTSTSFGVGNSRTLNQI